MLRSVAGAGNRQAYQAMKREWKTLSQDERARRRRAVRAAAARVAAAGAAAPAGEKPAEKT
jgi:hypothetical protein